LATARVLPLSADDRRPVPAPGWPLVFGLLCFCAATAAPARALPAGGTVTSGSATLVPSSNRLDITQTTDNVIIEYSDFSIGVPETVRFFQPGPDSAALNRVVSGPMSQIDGQLLANGRVFLINPSGIVFSNTAQVSTHGLVASALGISDIDFLAGNYAFSGGGPSATVQNFGNIGTDAGGYVHLIGSTVENYGTINSPQGSVGLGGGSNACLFTDPGGTVLLQVVAPDGVADNYDTLQSEGGRVRMWAGVVNQEGLVSAKNMVSRPGGSDRVELIGQDKVLLSATSTTEAEGASGAADGGLVVLESPDGDVTVEFGGVVDVSGGPSGGDAGGVYAHAPLGTVDVAGAIDATAQPGSLSRPVHLRADYVLLEGTINTQGGDVKLEAGGDLVINGNVAAQEACVDLSALGAIDVGGSVTVQTGDVYAYAEGGVVTRPGSTIAVSGQGDVEVLAPGGEYFVVSAGKGQPDAAIGVVDLGGALGTQDGSIYIGGQAGVVLQPTAQVSTAAGSLVYVCAGSAFYGVEMTMSEAARSGVLPGAVNVGGSVAAASGDIVLAADEVHVEPAGRITNTGPGGIELASLAGDMSVTGVLANGNVTATAQGAILDGGDEVIDIQADALELLGENGIAVGSDLLEIDAATLAAATQSGGVYLADVGDGLEVATVGGTSGVSVLAGVPGEDIIITASSPLMVSSAINTASAGGVIELEGGEVLIQDGGSVVNAGGGDVTIRSTSEDVALTGVSGSSVVHVSSAAGIVDGGDAATDIVAPDVELVAASGIGEEADRLAIDAVRLAATTDTGGVHVQDGAGGLELADVGSTSGVSIQTGAAGDGIDIVALSPLTVTSDVTAAGGASVRLSAGGTAAADDLIVDGTVFASGGGTVELLAGDQVIVRNGDVDADSGGILLNAAGDVWIQSGATVGATTVGSIELTADSDADLAGTVLGEVGSAIGNPSAAGAMVLTGADIVLDGSLTGIGELVIQPSSPAASIGIAGGAGDFPLSESDIASLAGGFSSLTIGRADGAHAITVGAVTFYVPVSIRAPASGGSITVDGAIVGADGASVGLYGSGATTTLNADIVTEGNAIYIDDAVVLGTPTLITLDTTSGGAVLSGADVTLTGAVDDAVPAGSGLVINAGTAGAVELQSAVGATAAPASLDATGNIISLNAVTTSGPQTYAGAGAVPSVLVNADLTAGGALTVRDALTVDVAGGVNLTAGGALNISDGVTVLNLTGPDGSTNVIGAGGDASVTLASITSTANPNLTVNAEGGVALNSVDIGTGTLSINVDDDADGAEAMRAGAVAAGVVNVAGSDRNDGMVFDGSVVAFSFAVSDADTVDLNADIVTEANPILIDGALVLGAPALVTLDTTGGGAFPTGGDVTISGAVDDDDPVGSPSALVINGGTDGAVSLQDVSTGDSQTYDGVLALNGDLTASGGSILLNGPVTLGADVAVATTGTSGDITFADVVDGAHALTLDSAEGAVTLAGPAGGTTPLAALSATAGNIDLSAVTVTGDVAFVSTVGDIVLTDVTAGTVVSLNSAGAVVDGGDSLTDIVATEVELVAVSDIGASDDMLELDVARMAAASEAGGIYVEDVAGDLEIGTVGSTTGVSLPGGTADDRLYVVCNNALQVTDDVANANGPVRLYATAAATVGGAATVQGVGVEIGAPQITVEEGGSVASDSADMQLSGDDLAVAGSLSTQGANLVLEGVTVAHSGDATATDGTVAITADDALTVTGTVAAEGGAVDLEAGAVTLTGVSSDTAVSVQSAASIQDAGDEATDVAGPEVELIAGTGIGLSENAIEIDAVLVAAATDEGGIHLVDVGDGLEVGEVGETTGVSVLGGVAGDDISIVVSSPLTVSAPVSNLATDGNVWLSASDLVGVGAAVSADSGAISIEAGELTVLEGGSIANGGVGNVSLTTTVGDAVIARVSGGGLVTVQSAAAVLDGAQTETDVVAPDIELIAESGIAEAADYLEIDAERLAAATQSGGIYIEDVADGLEVTSVGSTGGASILGVTAGDIYLAALSPLTVTEDVTNLSGGGIILAARGTTAGDDLSLGGDVVVVGDGTIQLFAGSDILQAGGVSAEGGTVLLTAGDLISLAGTVATGTGHVVAQAGRTVDVSGSIQTQGGGVALRSGGAVTVSGSVTTHGGNFSVASSTFDDTGGTIDAGGGRIIISLPLPAAVAGGTEGDAIADLVVLLGEEAGLAEEEEEEEEGAAEEAEAAALAPAHPHGDGRPAL